MPRVKVKLYSLLRELAGANEIILEINGDPRVSQVLEELMRKVPSLNKVRELNIDFLVLDDNGKRLDSSDHAKDGIIHIMPPPSGGEDKVMVRIKDSPISPEDIENIHSFLMEEVGESSSIGAILIFIGVVRGINRGRRVRKLIYEAAGDLTIKKFKEISLDIAKKEGVLRAAGVHSIGSRKPGEITLVVGVSGENRKHVFPALQEYIERVKHELPIWKKEVTESGEYYLLRGDEVEIDSL